MRFAGVAVVVLMSGCIRDNLIDCGNGIVCPSGTACATVEEVQLCVPPDSFAACVGLQERDACMLDEDLGTCHGGACLPDECGNSLLDSREACDDGNTITGDGCSSDCNSDESCGNGVVDPLVLVGDVVSANEQCDDRNLVSHDGCSSRCQTEILRWEPHTLSLPTGHFHHAVAYDSARDRIVMFGGAYVGNLSVTVPRNDTWEWDGVGWIRIPTNITPSARSGHVMAYDPVRRRTVMFGGGSTGTLFGDTWEWDGTTWTLKTPAVSPPPRRLAAAVYDPIRARIVMFGGGSQTAGYSPVTSANGDTWEWDGTTWTERVLVPSPPARAIAGMAFDPIRGVSILAGGLSPTESFNDTWEYDGTRWNLLPATLPVSGTTNRLAFDGIGILALASAADTTLATNTLRFDGQAWTRPVPVGQNEPTTRRNAAMVFDPRRGRVLLVQGFHQMVPCVGSTCAEALVDVDAWDQVRWTPVTVPTPPARAYHATAFNEDTGCLLVFGGGDASSWSPIPADTWELCGDHWIAHPGPQPPARTFAKMAYDRERKQTVLFGGRGSGGAIGDTWIWNGSTWTQFAGSGPSNRYAHAMAFDPVARTILLFGGFAPGVIPNTTWEWNGSWTQRFPATAPRSRQRATMEFDPIRGRLIMLGGDDGTSTFNDLWEWDGSNWIELMPALSPPARSAYGFAWSGSRRRGVLFAGSTQTFSLFDDLWELTGTTWTQLFASGGPGIRFGHSLTPLRDGVLAFGGGNGMLTIDELWRLRWDDDGANELCTIDADTDGDGLAGCTDPDCWSVCTPLCAPGTTCPATAPRCGDSVCNTALETCRMCPGDCGACKPACGDNVCDPPETAASCPGDCS